MKAGYARVSTQDQNLDMQVTELNKAGCDIIYHETVSGLKEREQLYKCLNRLNKGDTLVCYKLDRLGRSTREVVNIVYDLSDKGVHIISLSDRFDTSTASGKLMMDILISFASFERNLISDRTKIALQTAKANGKKLGRPKYLNKTNVKLAKKMYKQGYKREKIREILNISESTLYRYLNQ